MELKFGITTQMFSKREIEINTGGSLYVKTPTIEVYLHREPKLPPAPHLETLPDGSIWQAFGWELIITRLGPRRFLLPRR